MPQLERWDNLPKGRQHLIERMRDRAISIPDLNQLRRWVAKRPEVPEGRLVQGFRLFQDLRQRMLPKNVPPPRASCKGEAV